MKKSHLILGIVLTAVGGTAYIKSWFMYTELGHLLNRYGLIILFAGLIALYDYIKSRLTMDERERQEKLEAEEIEAHDELKIKVRDKAGRYAFILGSSMLFGAAVLLDILSILGIIGDVQTLKACLTCFFMFQYIAYRLFCNHLMKKY